MQHIYHITTSGEYRRAALANEYVPGNFAADGFIHCAYAHQVAQIAKNNFRGRTGLLLLEIDPARLSCRVVDEHSPGSEQGFPHVYGHLPLSAVVAIHEFSCDADGDFTHRPL